MEKTVAVRLKGGLGNQLFQYAAGRYFAQKWQRDLVLLTDFLKRPAGNYTARQFDLGQFGLEHLLASDQKENELTSRSFLQKIGVQKKPLIISESNFFEAENHGGQVILDGYFQSEIYFSSMRPMLLKELKASFYNDPEFIKFRSALVDDRAVAIHIRRGDYVSLESAAQYHGALDMSYFTKAIAHIKQREDNPRFVVFSDDIPWCIQNFPANDEFVFQNAPNKHTGTDMMLMSSCKHQVISNSSYSWWAAWLNENPERMVIAPMNWYNDPAATHGEIYCDKWVRL